MQTGLSTFKAKIYPIVVGAGLLVLLGCAEKKPTMVIYTTHGKELVQTFVDLFEKDHPQVQVRWLDMGSQDALDRIRSEKGNPQADLWWGAPAPIFMRAKKEGLLQPYRPTWAEQVDSMYRDPEDMWYGTFLTPEVIAFNREKLSREQAPQDWDDLLKPEWKGRVVIRSPLASGTMRAIFVAMILRQMQKTGRVEDGFEWLRQLDANTRSYAADPTMLYLKLARGEGDVTLWNMPDIMLQRSLYNYPFDYIIPRSGTVVVTDCIALVKGAKQPELAKAFYEFVTSKEALIRQAHEFYRIPARRDIPREKLPEWMRAPIKVLPLDWELFAEKETEWMEYWNQHIRSRGR